MSLRSKLDELKPAECLVWIQGEPGVAQTLWPFPMMRVALLSWLKSNPQPDGTKVMVAEHAGWVRRFVKRAGGRLTGGRMHEVHTSELRKHYRPRKLLAGLEPVNI